jgi:hypothetical protein
MASAEVSALRQVIAAQHEALIAQKEVNLVKDAARAAEARAAAAEARAAAAELRAATSEAALAVERAARDASARDVARGADALAASSAELARLRRLVWQLEDRLAALVPRMDIIGLCVAAGFTEVGERCAGLCRETWTALPADLSEADAARARGAHPIWPRIIDLKHGEHKETRLSWAARKGKVSRVRELCDWLAGVDVAGECGCTSLYVASERGHLDVVCELLARGAKTEVADAEGRTSLFIASQDGFLDIVRALLARGAKVDAANSAGTTALIQASWKGRVAVVRVLLEAGANKRHLQINRRHASTLAGNHPSAHPTARAEILALLNARR